MFTKFASYMFEAQDRVINAKKHPLYAKRKPQEIGVPSKEEVEKALKKDANSQRIAEKGHKHEHGELVGVRLNLNVLKSAKVAVQTVHKGTNKGGYKKGQGFYHGEALSHQSVVTLKNAYFNVNQLSRENIVNKKTPKAPMASVDGEYQQVDSHSFDGVEARFNPMLHHTFVDGNNRAIKSAEEVTIHGHRVYMRGKIEYHTAETAPKRKGDTASASMIINEDMMSSTYDIYFEEDK